MSCRPKTTIGLAALAMALVLVASGCVMNGSWTTTAPAPAQGPPDLYTPTFRDVSCTSPDWCMAVGSASTPLPSVAPRHPQVQLWDGTTWTTAAPPLVGTGGGYADLVACSSPDLCVASVESGTSPFQRWDGEAWHVLPGARQYLDDSPAMACAPDGSCTIVDGWYSTLTVWADGSSTSVDHGDGPLITDVWCAEADDCLGFNRFIGGAHHWDGATWSDRTGFPVPTSASAFTKANDVACASPTSCTAVGTERLGPVGAPWQAWSVHWDGTTWTELEVPAATVLWHVSCPSATECVAEGYPIGSSDESAILAWNGDSWFEAPSPAVDVSVFELDCVAQECMAVGNRGPLATQELAAERYGWTNP